MSNRGPSIWHGVFLRCAICSRAGLAQGCLTHAQYGIIGARSASQLAPDSVAAMGNECLCSSASLPSHCNQKYTMRSNIFVLDRILSQSGTLKRCHLKTAFPMNVWLKSSHFAVAVNKNRHLGLFLSWYGVVNSHKTHFGDVALVLLFFYFPMPVRYKCVKKYTCP